MPPVSVVIPAYDPGRHLHLALASLCEQTMSDWEAVVVDDGSNEELSWVGEIDPRIRYSRQHNQGQSAARNAGIAGTGGQYIAFLDQDDLWLSNKLQRQVELLESDDSMVACHTQFELIDATGHRSASGYGRRQSYEQMLEGTGICGASTVMVRRAALVEVGGFHDCDRPAEDLDLWLRLARLGGIGFIDDVLAQYRIHGENQSLKYKNLFSAIERIQLRQLAIAPQLSGHIRKGITNYSKDASGKAFEQLRSAVRQRSVFEMAAHCVFILNHRPKLLAQAVLGRFRRAER